MTMKLCECGCGQPTPIAKQTASRLGHVKGQPVRFIQGHWAKTGAMLGSNHPQWKGGRLTHVTGYIMVAQDGHPRANEGGYVLEHIVIAEKALGRYLPKRVEVHHVNECRADNRGNNLVICDSRDYHRLLHLRMRAYRACGNPEARRCGFCRVWGTDVKVLSGGGCEHPACGNAYRRQR